MKNKIFLTLLIVFSTTIAQSQLHVGLAAGSGTDKNIVTDVRIGYHSSQFLFEAHEILDLSNAKPCYFGARVGKMINLSPSSFLIPTAGYYYSVFTNDKTTKDENYYEDPSLVNKFVYAFGVMYVSGKCSIEVRQINNTYQMTIGLWNILKRKN